MAKRRKKATPLRRALRTTLPIVLWLVFSWWYTNTAGPLSAEEIDNYISALEAQGTDPERREMMRAFLENDTGDDFVMINLIELNRSSSIENPHAEAQTALDTYMSHMWPALLRRGCHPVTFGSSAARALDVWGIDGAQTWTQGAMMRYRSRRDLLEIATNQDFQGPHEAKIAAMNKTIAVPLDPWTNTGDPRLLLGLIALIATLVGLRR